MADSRRGLIWRAAWLVAVVAVMVLWRMTAGNPTRVIQIEFGMAPEVFVGAEVLVDLEVVGVLERRRGRTLNGFEVAEGPRIVQLRKEGFDSESLTVEVGAFGSGPLRLMADLEDRGRGASSRPVMVLR